MGYLDMLDWDNIDWRAFDIGCCRMENELLLIFYYDFIISQLLFALLSEDVSLIIDKT